MSLETEKCLDTVVENTTLENTVVASRETAIASKSAINSRALFYIISGALVPITKAVQAGQPVDLGVILEAIALSLLAWRSFIDISVARAEPPKTT